MPSALNRASISRPDALDELEVVELDRDAQRGLRGRQVERRTTSRPTCAAGAFAGRVPAASDCVAIWRRGGLGCVAAGCGGGAACCGGAAWWHLTRPSVTSDDDSRGRADLEQRQCASSRCSLAQLQSRVPPWRRLRSWRARARRPLPHEVPDRETEHEREKEPHPGLAQCCTHREFLPFHRDEVDPAVRGASVGGVFSQSGDCLGDRGSQCTSLPARRARADVSRFPELVGIPYRGCAGLSTAAPSPARSASKAASSSTGTPSSSAFAALLPALAPTTT